MHGAYNLLSYFNCVYLQEGQKKTLISKSFNLLSCCSDILYRSTVTALTSGIQEETLNSCSSDTRTKTPNLYLPLILFVVMLYIWALLENTIFILPACYMLVGLTKYYK